MAGLISWLKSATLLDPQRGERIRNAAAEVERQLAVQRKNFSVDRVISSLDLFREDVPLVIEQTYRSLVTRAWRDATITEGERRTLEWASTVLNIAPHRARELCSEAGLEAFRQCLIRIMSDGRLVTKELTALQGIAKEIGIPISELMQTYFAKEASGLLRGMFAQIISDAKIAKEEWASLLQAASALGLTQDSLLDAIQVQAEQLIEQSLADAKSDEHLSLEEEHALEWLLANIVRNSVYTEYVHAQVAELKLIAAIEAGHLPSITSRQIGMRAGEIIHAETPVQFNRIKQLSSGQRTDIYDGQLTLTDSRLIFSSPVIGFEVNHRKVIELVEYRNGFSLTAGTKGTGTYIPSDRPELFNRIYRTAIRLVNQTTVRKLEASAPSRHIPRDVRQRVWQRYGGKCAQCAATDYLEFDHIIPFSKGGASTDGNVQLLCRHCNGQKSDLI